MIDIPFLTILIFLPILSAAAILLMANQSQMRGQPNGYKAALFTSLVTCVVAVAVWVEFEIDYEGFQFREYHLWSEKYGIAYHLAIDGISLYLILLTTLLTPICIIASKHITERANEFYALFLLMEGLVIGAFSSLDLLLFYFFFEATLIPMFLIIGKWGGEHRIYAAYKFFLFTLCGSLFFLAAIIFIFLQTQTTNIQDLYPIVSAWPLDIQKWLWLAFFASFAVKLPMWPVHTWLPDAHVQAPTAGSVMLAGILLKLGGYGFMRLSLPFFPEASAYFTDFVFILSVIAIIYTSMVALVQTDMKKLIAYSSVAHMAFVTIGIFSMTEQGLQGAYFQMLSHGVISAALFLCVGVLYDRVHTKEIARYSGIATPMPLFAAVFMLFMLASVGLPGTSGFVGEFLVIVGAFKVNTVITTLAATSLILGAAYMLFLYKRVMFGEIRDHSLKALSDLERHEWISFAPLILLVVILGILPRLITDAITPALQMMQHVSPTLLLK